MHGQQARQAVFEQADLAIGVDHRIGRIQERVQFRPRAQAQHGSAPDLAGRNIANPASLIGSAAMLMHWLGERRAEPAFQSAAVLMHRALEATCSAPQTRTTDLGGTLGTDAFTAAVLENLEAFAE